MCKQLIIRSLFWFEPHRAMQQIKDQDIGDKYDDGDDDDDDDDDGVDCGGGNTTSNSKSLSQVH